MGTTLVLFLQFLLQSMDVNVFDFPARDLAEVSISSH